MKIILSAMLLTALCTAVGIIGAMGREPTTLDEAVNRQPEPVMRYIDLDTQVACYYRKNKHGMSCVIPEKFPYPR